MQHFSSSRYASGGATLCLTNAIVQSVFIVSELVIGSYVESELGSLFESATGEDTATLRITYFGSWT